MKTLIINIGDVQHAILTKIANKSSISPEQYATNVLVSWINEQINGAFIKKIKNKSVAELHTLLGDPSNEI